MKRSPLFPWLLGLLVLTAFVVVSLTLLEVGTDSKSGVATPNKQSALSKKVEQRKEQLQEKLESLKSKKKTLTFRVVSSAKIPIVGAALSLTWNLSTGGVSRFNLLTDTNGTSEFPVLVNASLRLEVHATNFAPKLVEWRVNPQSKDVIPGDYTLTLPEAITIGGTVLDPEGKPIPNVSIRTESWGSYKSDQRENLLFDVTSTEKTDAEGRWTCNHVPKGFYNFHVSFSHPDFLPVRTETDRMESNLVGVQKISAVLFTEKKATLTLQRGSKFSGKVLDPNGKPLTGASVLYGQTHHHQGAVTTQSDEQGLFTFNRIDNAKITLTATKAKFAPARQTFNSDETNIILKLRAPRVVEIVLQNSAGVPLAGVNIGAQKWIEHGSLEWRARTDAEGKAIWDSAPPEEVEFYVQSADYIRASPTVPAGTNLTRLPVTLNRKIAVSGKVVDEVTGESLAQFRVQPFFRTQWDSNWLPPHELTHAKNGKYSTSLAQPAKQYGVQIQADGYETQTSKMFEYSPQDLVIDFKMKKAVSFTGVVLDPDGKPATRAQVGLQVKGQQFTLGKATFKYREEKAIVDTDEFGKFSMGKLPDEFAFALVVHPSGFRQLDPAEFQSSKAITLLAWGKVTGVVKVKGKIAPSQTLQLVWQNNSSSTYNLDYFSWTATSDDQGKFAFDHVPQGKFRVVRMIRLSENSSTYSGGEDIEVAAGKTVDVIIGGKGRPVIGKISIAGKDAKWMTGKTLSVNLTPRVSPTPENRTRIIYPFAARMNKDVFKAEDVPPGNYTLNVNLNEEVDLNWKNLASMQKEVTVPGAETETADFDLGTVEVVPKP